MSRAGVPLLVSLMVNVDSEGGHPIPYNQAVARAARGLGWDTLGALPTGTRIGELPSGWSASLERIRYSRGSGLGQRGWPEAVSVWRAARAIHTYLSTAVLPRKQPTILFIEFFIFAHLTALVLALLALPRANLSIWLLYRIDIQRQPTRRLYRLLNAILRRLVGGRLKLLTDSELLGRALAPTLGQPLTVVPIPHAEASGPVSLPEIPVRRERPDTLICWWPGAMRADKGLDVLRRLAGETGPAARRSCLVVPRVSDLEPTAGGCTVQLIADELPRADYQGWMAAADIVLLPYSVSSYIERTSGIFVEAITAGKLTPTTAGTWMAAELLAHDLPELVVDWDAPAIWETLLTLTADKSLRPKLAAMQARYAHYHSEQTYAECLRQLYVSRL